jgi:FkbM family methyltransferase
MGLLYLSIIKSIVDLLPTRFKYAAAKRLYDFDNSKRKSIWLVVDYLKNQYDLKYFIDTKDYIGWSIFFLGDYEKDTNEIIAEYVKPGMTVIEAGANHGSETVILGKIVGKTGKVYAFEPVPRLFNHLKLNIDINNLGQNTIPIQLAIGEKDDQVVFHLPAADAANQGMPSKYTFSGATIEINVVQKSLDNWLVENEVTEVGFIKMDIQGAEIDLIRGAQNCFQKMRPILYLEADETQSGNSKHNLSDLFKLLIASNYSVNLVEPQKMYPINLSNLKSGNWLALPN